MIAAIEYPEQADVVCERIACSVNDSYAAQRWPLFSRAQRAAVAAYLRFQIQNFADADHERKALAILEHAA